MNSGIVPGGGVAVIGISDKFLIQSQSENSRAEQSRLTAPAMSVVQHTATLLHTAPLALASPLVVRPLLPPTAAGGAARATATLAATVVIMKKNRMLMRSVGLD